MRLNCKPLKKNYTFPFRFLSFLLLSYRNLEYKAPSTRIRNNPYVTIKNRFLGNGSTHLKTPLRLTISKTQPESFNRMQLEVRISAQVAAYCQYTAKQTS